MKKEINGRVYDTQTATPFLIYYPSGIANKWNYETFYMKKNKEIFLYYSQSGIEVNDPNGHNYYLIETPNNYSISSNDNRSYKSYQIVNEDIVNDIPIIQNLYLIDRIKDIINNNPISSNDNITFKSYQIIDEDILNNIIYNHSK